MNTNFSTGTATFVMAHWTNNHQGSKTYLDQAIDSLFNQTDNNWQLVIIDDNSPSEDAIAYLKELEIRHPGKITVILKKKNEGPGISRNVGIHWAYTKGSPFILYMDADDISHPKRLEAVRKSFVINPQAAVVYSSFKIIDENNNIVEEQYLTQSILEILEGHKDHPVEGKDAWIAIGTEKGYTNLTSSTAVRSDVAYNYPFPPETVSEDQHTWLRYSAGGGDFIYLPEVPSLYRIPQGTPTVSRARIENYYEKKAAVDTEGFFEAMKITEEKGKTIENKDEILIKFYIKLGETLGREEQYDLAAQQVLMASAISKIKTQGILLEKNLLHQKWVNV